MRKCCCVSGHTDTLLGRDFLCPIYICRAKINENAFNYTIIINNVSKVHVFNHYLDNVFSTKGFVRICTTNEETAGRHFRQHSDIILAVILKSYNP